MLNLLHDTDVRDVVGGLMVTFIANDNTVNAPDAALGGLSTAVGSVLGRGGHSIANLVVPGEPTLAFDAGSQGIY